MGSLFSSAILGCEARFRSRRIETIAASSTPFRMPKNPNFIETEGRCFERICGKARLVSEL